MAWNGYFTYAGQEFINATRTEAYAVQAGAYWLRGCIGNTDLGPMLGEQYRSPLLDPAPWTDPDAPESYGFFGVYPLDVTGLEDSTRSGTVVESISDGGTVGRIRHTTKTVVFNVALVGDNECAVEYGARWLRRLLLGAACGTQVSEACAGEDLCYLSCEPIVDWEGEGSLLDILDCLTPYERSLRRVVFNSGPTITAKRTTSDGSAVWTATMTAVAGNPWEFGAETPIVELFGLVDDPFVCDPPGMVNMDGPIVDDTGCIPVDNVPVFDPACPAFVVPPAPVDVPLGCYTPPKNWKRRQFTIPQEFIPLWGEVVPKIEISAPGVVEVRNLRLRFYADVDGDNDINDDVCAYCGDIVVSYVPAGETLVIDGSDQLVYVEGPGGTGQRRADSLVFSTDGKPFEWPVLSCGFGYIVTVDLPQTATPPGVGLSLYARAA
jgi:hypothetical protein